MQDKSRPSPDQRPPLLDFAPVPRKVRRNEGWTPERQRAFIAALADTGSVTAAAKRVNMHHATAYDLYNHPEGVGFRAAWDQALSLGIRRLHDAAMERALGGVAVPIIHGGEQVGEKRVFNDHLLMQLLRHHAGDGCNSPIGRRSQAAREREAAENCPNCRERRVAEEEAADQPSEEEEAKAFYAQIEAFYDLKVRAERRLRIEGDYLGADFTLRQMTALEIALAQGGRSDRLTDLWDAACEVASESGGSQSAVADLLATLRQETWAKSDDRPRPFCPTTIASSATGGGPTIMARFAAQRDAQTRIAAAQWEAAQNEERWAAWQATHWSAYPGQRQTGRRAKAPARGSGRRRRRPARSSRRRRKMEGAQRRFGIPPSPNAWHGTTSQRRRNKPSATHHIA